MAASCNDADQSRIIGCLSEFLRRTKVEPSKLSPMPPDLVDGLSATELRDLLAFLLSRGQGLGAAK